MVVESNNDTIQMKIIHKTPNMTNDERNRVKTRISGELYEIFLRIRSQLKSQLKSDNEI